MSAATPAEWISCNTCLIDRGYIRIVHCDPRVEGWPYAGRQCARCDYGGWDCETWLRVKGVGEGVGKALRRLDSESVHPVTWADIGLVPFKDGTDPQFESKAALDDYCTKLSREYPNECGYLSSAMSKTSEEPCPPQEDAEPQVDLKVLDEAILKVLAYKPKKKD